MPRRPKPKARRRAATAAPLTADLIVAAALDLVDDVGVADMTMRAVADRLGTYPASLYWHVGNRDEILTRVHQLVMNEMDVPDPMSMRWDRWLARVAHEYRRAFHAHPNAAVLALYPVRTEPTFVEAMISALHRGGFTGATLADAFNTFTGSVAGWVAVELSAVADVPDDAWRTDFEEALRNLSPAEFPTITANLCNLADQAFTLRWHTGSEKPLDASFDTALTVWLAGLRSLLPPRRR